MDRNTKIISWDFNRIRLRHTVTTFQDYSSFSASSDDEYVRLHLGLKGDYRFTYKQLNESFDLIGGHHNIMYSDGIDLEVQNKAPVLETFGIDFPKEVFMEFTKDGDDLLKEFINEILEGKNTILSKNWGTLNVGIQSVVDEIILNTYAGQLRDVFLLAKSLELLVLCVDNYKLAGDEKVIYLKNKKDKEKVIEARDYISEHITCPPNLSDIAKVVGLNEFKLKRGFKEMFNSTIFGYLTERRLNLAMQYLRDSQKTAAQISFELGYSSPQHFNTQFRNKFGLTPNSIRNNP